MSFIPIKFSKLHTLVFSSFLKSQSQWLPVILAIGKLRQEDLEQKQTMQTVHTDMDC